MCEKNKNFSGTLHGNFGRRSKPAGVLQKQGRLYATDRKNSKSREPSVGGHPTFLEKNPSFSLTLRIPKHDKDIRTKNIPKPNCPKPRLTLWQSFPQIKRPQPNDAFTLLQPRNMASSSTFNLQSAGNVIGWHSCAA